MNDKLIYTTEIYLAFKNNDLAARLKQFRMMTDSFLLLTQSLFDSNEKMEYFQTELENKYVRFGLANLSIENLLHGFMFKLGNRTIHTTDLFSVYNLMRLQIESFSIIFYLFFDDVTENEKVFRYDIYKLHGLIKQGKFKPKSGETQIQVKKINEEIEEIRDRIRNNSIYKEADAKSQDRYLFPAYAKIKKTKELLIHSGLDKKGFFDMWNLFSNYAHNEHISDRQYNSIFRDKKSTLDESNLVLSLISILSSRLINYLVNSFGGVKEKFEKLPIENKTHIDFWNELINTDWRAQNRSSVR